MIALSIARRTPASESALEIMLRSREGAQSKKFRLAAATAFSCDYGHTSTNRGHVVFRHAACGAGLKKETARVLDNRQSCDRHHISRQKRPLFFDGFDISASAGLLGLVNPAAALGDEALGKRGEGCRASPLLRRGRTVQTLANVYEDRAAEYSRAAQQTDDPVFRRLLLMLASQWELAGQQEAKSKDAPTSLASTQPQP
jgi:hypothetical protein